MAVGLRMTFRLSPLPGETEIAFAARRLRTATLALAIVAVLAACYWLVNPRILVLEYGALAFFASALVALAIFLVGLVLVVATPLFLAIYLWHLLEQRFPQIQRPRKIAENAVETVLILVGLAYSTVVLYGALTTGVIDSFGRAGFKHRRIAAEDSLLFFSIYLALWGAVWCALAIWAVFKARSLHAR